MTAAAVRVGEELARARTAQAAEASQSAETAQPDPAAVS
jgi:hypothetical protein